MIRSALPVAVLCLAILALPPCAEAQVNPFHSSRAGTGLSGDDWTLMDTAAARLYQQNPVADGAADQWSNPKTGNSGTVTVLQSFERGGTACRKVRYDIRLRIRAGKRSYTVNWCKTPSGAWKVA